MLRLRGEEYDPVFISGERHDVLRRVDGELKLAKRRILLDQTVMGTQNLSEFL
jgi:3-phenylpropionate/cinnamic acid dioxygenase small subunit